MEGEREDIYMEESGRKRGREIVRGRESVRKTEGDRVRDRVVEREGEW